MTDMQHQDSHEDDKESATVPAISDFALRYPEIPLHLSLESLHDLSQSSRLIPSRIMPSSQANLPGLDESWASLTDIESLSGDDLRSDHTDVGSLLDVHNSDDVYSVFDEISATHGRPADGDNAVDNASDLGRTRILRVQEPTNDDVQSGSDQVKEETEKKDTASPPFYTKISPLSKEQGCEIQQWFPKTDDSTTYSGIVQMTLMEQGLDLDTLGYFKIVLLGKQVEQFRPELQRKLGDALAARSETTHNPRSSISRFHLVPNSFGPGSKPEYADLVAIDKQIDFECFDSIEEFGRPKWLQAFLLKDSQSNSEVVSRWDGRRYMATNPRWTLPDLAIICVDLEGDFLDSQSRAFLRFASRHGIPKIIVRMDRGWHGSYNLRARDSMYLYETVEARTEHLQSVDRLEPLPVHMGHFLNFDAATLNKHIAFITSKSDDNLPQQLVDAVNQLYKIAEKPTAYLRLFLPRNTSLIKDIIITLWVLGVYIFLGAHLLPIMLETLSGTSCDAVRDIAQTSIAPSMMQTWTTATPGSEIPTDVPVAQVSSHDMDRTHVGQQNLAVASPSATHQLKEDALHFQVGVANDNQFMVKLPKIATSRKKRSPLSVMLKRNNDTVPAVVHELLDGVYSIQLQPHDAFGDIEVNLTMTKPSLSETLTVSFGERWTFWSRLSFREAIHVVDKQMHGTMTALSSMVPIDVEVVSGKLDKLREGVQHKLEELTNLKANIVQSAQSARAGFRETSEKRATERRRTVTRLFNEMSGPGIALSRLFNGTDFGWLKHELNPKAVVVEKLATAQERARQMVANAEARLRSHRNRL